MVDRFSLEDAYNKFNWYEMVVEGIKFDKNLKQMSFDTRIYRWTPEKEFVGHDGFLHFFNVSEIVTEPIVSLVGLQSCRLTFSSSRHVMTDGKSFLELETSVTGNYQECEIGYMTIRISAEYVTWQPSTYG